jgi:penicillin-binding protein 1A
VAAEVTRILEENIQSGTGVGANIGRTAGGKTGTTENHADAWFCGITPTLSTTVWVGYPQAEIPMTSVHGISVAGGTFPATIWRLFMEEAIGPTPERDFPEALSEPIWHSFTPGHYGGPPPPPTYYYNPPPASTTTPTQPPPAAPQPPPPPSPKPKPVPVPIVPPPPPPEPPPVSPPPAPPPPQP